MQVEQEGKKRSKVSPTLKHVDQDLLVKAQGILMKGIVAFGEIASGTTHLVAAQHMRQCLDSMYFQNMGLIPQFMETKWFKQEAF